MDVGSDVEVRIAGGREIHLRSMQPLALYLANSLFLGDLVKPRRRGAGTGLPANA